MIFLIFNFYFCFLIIEFKFVPEVSMLIKLFYLREKKPVDALSGTEI